MTGKTALYCRVSTTDQNLARRTDIARSTVRKIATSRERYTGGSTADSPETLDAHRPLAGETDGE